MQNDSETAWTQWRLAHKEMRFWMVTSRRLVEQLRKHAPQEDPEVAAIIKRYEDLKVMRGDWK